MNTSDKTCVFLDIQLDQTSAPLTPNAIVCFLNSVCSIITCIGNAVILHVIRTRQELQSPSFFFLFCLAASDLLVGLICQPSFVAFKIAELGNHFKTHCILSMAYGLSSWTTSGASLLTLSVVSIDRLLALTLHLRYNTIVTVPRVFQTAVCLWVFAITIVILRFWIKNWILFPLLITLLTFFVTTLSTLKIFQIVRRHQRQITQQHQSVQSNTTDVLKCRKSAVTVLYVYGLFLISYLPVLLVMLIETAFTEFTLTMKIAYDYAATLVFMNSLLNPVVYCWRIREIRRAVKDVFRVSRRM